MLNNKLEKGSTTTTVVIIVIVIVVVLLVVGLVGCGVYYWWKNAQDNTTPVQPTAIQTSAQTQTSVSASATQTSTTTQAQTTESPQDVVTKFMRYTLGTIPGASIDYEAAKNLTSYELAQKINGSIIPLAYCIQQGPDDVKVNVDSNDNTIAYVTASTNYGGEWDKRWEFEVVNGSGGWKIKYIKCIGTGQITQ